MALGIGDISIGISTSGVNDYLRDINRIAIQEAESALRNSNNVKAALQAGWQGRAEMNFEKNLDLAVNNVCKSLETMKQGLDSLFASLIESMAEQDKLMVDISDDIVNL